MDSMYDKPISPPLSSAHTARAAQHGVLLYIGALISLYVSRHTGHIIRLLSGIAEPAPHMPELEAACRKAANRVGEHEADRKQRQRYQRRSTQLTFFLRRELRCDRKRRQRCTAMALRQCVLMEADVSAEYLAAERKIPDAADDGQYAKCKLFASLLKPFLADIEATFQSVKADYYSGADGGLLAQLRVSMQHESAAILRLILAHYNEAVLLFYKSAGSSLERFFDMVVQRKIDESAAFFRSMGYTGIDEKLLGLLISVQFDSYRRWLYELADDLLSRRLGSAL